MITAMKEKWEKKTKHPRIPDIGEGGVGPNAQTTNMAGILERRDSIARI